MSRLERCPLCGAAAFEPLFMVGPQGVERCPACSLVLLNPPPVCDDDVLYAEGYYRGHCAAKQSGEEDVLEADRIRRRLESCRGVLQDIESALGRQGRLLDLGCGPGFLLKAAAEAGWQVAGVDVSRFAAEYARERFGIRDVQAAPLERVEYPSGSFDAVTLQHVIEHFRDPVAMIRKIKRWLAPGGLLWLETPDIESGRAKRDGARWTHLKVPEHLFYFSEGTLRALLRAAGFRVLSVRREVEGTGLLHAVCGGQAGARRFYERVRGNALVRTLIGAVRYANELYRARLKGESDVIRLLATTDLR